MNSDTFANPNGAPGTVTFEQAIEAAKAIKEAERTFAECRAILPYMGYDNYNKMLEMTPEEYGAIQDMYRFSAAFLEAAKRCARYTATIQRCAEDLRNAAGLIQPMN